MCSADRDCYTFNTGMYIYRDACAVPPLGMIDDVAGIAQCKDDSNMLNAIINAKIETKKLEFNLTKCVNMHIGPGKDKCDKLKVHKTEIKTASTQKYLGDLVCSSGKNSENVNDRCKTGFKAISQIKSLIKEVGLGKFTIEIGLILRDSIFVSKMLLNSEVWHAVTKKQIEDLDKIDRILLRHILNAHCKTGLEWMYTDTGKFDLKSLV